MGGAVLPVDAMGAMALSDEAAGMFDDAEEDETSAAARSSWPEVVGQDAGTAMAAISAERPDLSVERVEGVQWSPWTFAKIFSYGCIHSYIIELHC
jgi:hypothetical protein